FPRGRLYQALDVPGVEQASPLYLSLTRWKHPITLEKGTVLLLGLDPNLEQLTRPDVKAQLDKIRLPDRILFDQNMRGDFDAVIAKIQQGTVPTTEINERQVRLNGLISVGSSFASDGLLLASDQTFLRLFPDRASTKVNLGLLQLAPGANADQVARRLDSYLPDDVQCLLDSNLLSLSMAIGRTIRRSALSSPSGWPWALWWVSLLCIRCSQPTSIVIWKNTPPSGPWGMVISFC
ncbi:MAG: hypothetical protein HC857_02865, partial [Synechococcales cyanobacterium RU_4_20]|nr:hypothetical protein [Synechococcales cyanobacterium RU_4_20]